MKYKEELKFEWWKGFLSGIVVTWAVVFFVWIIS